MRDESANLERLDIIASQGAELNLEQFSQYLLEDLSDTIRESWIKHQCRLTDGVLCRIGLQMAIRSLETFCWKYEIQTAEQQYCESSWQNSTVFQ